MDQKPDVGMETSSRKRRLFGRRRKQVGVAVVTLLILSLLQPPGVDAASGCTPGEDGCLPTPEQCATGGYNDFWDGGQAGRFAVCVGAEGHVASYVGGDAMTMCGVIIVADVPVQRDEYGRDPNDCPKVPLEPDAEHSANIKHFSNQAPSDPSHPQTDLAFWGKLAFAGNYGGVRIFDISSPAQPKLLADLDCYTRQGDVSVWEDLLVVSVDVPLTGSECGSKRVPSGNETLPSNFEGLRIFRISEILAAAEDAPNRRVTVNPIKVIPIDCGSHTNTLVPDVEKNDRVLIYVSSTGYNAGPRCGPENALVGNYNPIHKKISIVEIPLRNPASASVINEPELFAPLDGHPHDGVDRLHWRKSISCHDITVFLELELAAAACVSEAQLWDISDPANPDTVNAVHIDNPHAGFWHSAAFAWDGETVIFSDETEAASCNSTSQGGRMWFYDVKAAMEQSRSGSSETIKPVGSFQIPRNEGNDLCFAHNYNTMPIPGRDVAVMGAYGGGVSVVDFTYPDNAREIAHYDFEGEHRSDTWSAYWYNGLIYANDGIDWGTRGSWTDTGKPRGFDIYHLTDLSREGAKRFDYLNPQTQGALIRP